MDPDRRNNTQWLLKELESAVILALTDPERAHIQADKALIKYIGSPAVEEQFEALKIVPSIAPDFGWGELNDPNYYPKFEEVPDA